LVSCALSLDLPMPTHHHIGQFGRLSDVHGRSGVHNSRNRLMAILSENVRVLREFGWPGLPQISR
jgi:hypothetical protein